MKAFACKALACLNGVRGGLGFVHEEDAMPAGRPHEGANLVDRFAGSEEAKKRLKTIIEAMGDKTQVKDAIIRLGISETRFYQLRDEVLMAGLASMEPAKPGRPSSRSAEDAEEIARLRMEVKDLREQLLRERVRADVGQVLAISSEPADTEHSREFISSLFKMAAGSSILTIWPLKNIIFLPFIGQR